MTGVEDGVDVGAPSLLFGEGLYDAGAPGFMLMKYQMAATAMTATRTVTHIVFLFMHNSIPRSCHLCYHVRMISNKMLAIGGVILGVVLVVVAFIYWFTPANALPSFFPGHDPSLATPHFKHGLASLLLGLALFAFAWFRTGKKSAGQ